MKNKSPSRFKVYLAAYRGMFLGLENRRNDELFLQAVVRESTDIRLFDLAAFVLGRFGTMFSIPTLMAFLDDDDPKKRFSIAGALLEKAKRVRGRDAGAIWPMFDPSYWRIKWVAPKEAFLTYVACLGQLFDRERFLEPDYMDQLAERVIKEIDVGLDDGQDFKALRLTFPAEALEEDIRRLNTYVSQDMLMLSVTGDGAIRLSEEEQVKENLAFMHCEYLCARLRLPGDYQDNLYLLKALSTLNVSG